MAGTNDTVTYGVRDCKHCGASFVAISSRSATCSKECAKEVKRAWSAGRYTENRDKILAYSAAYHRANPEKARERGRKYDAAHPERKSRPRDPKVRATQWASWYERNAVAQRVRQREYAKANPDVRRRAQHARRARRYGSDSCTVTDRDLRRLLARFNGCCAYCRVPLSEMHWDHVFPLGRGGRHSIGNLVPSCPSCNQHKQARTIMEWRVRQATR